MIRHLEQLENTESEGGSGAGCGSWKETPLKELFSQSRSMRATTPGYANIVNSRYVHYRNYLSPGFLVPMGTKIASVAHM